MATPNYFDLSGHSTRISYYPNGRGGPILAGGPPANAPTLIYTHGATEVVATGDDLQSTVTKAGSFVVAVVKKSGIVPGGIVTFAVLIPDVMIDGPAVAIHTVGILSTHRGTAQLGAGQLESYTEVSLRGTAANIAMPL